MIQLTESAQDKLTEIINTQVTPHNHIRVSDVRGPHGCIHGWVLSLDHDPSPNDIVATCGNVPIVIAPDLVERLHGATIDYREDGNRALGFTIDTPEPRDHSGPQACHHSPNPQ